jgi:hypothetical protein
MKYILFAFTFVIISNSSFAQIDTLRYAYICIDDSNVKKEARPYDHCYKINEQFYGGRPALKVFLEKRLFPLLDNQNLPDGHVTISVKIDTLGFAYNIDVKSIGTAESFKDTITAVISTVQRWPTCCFYLPEKDKFICKTGLSIIIFDLNNGICKFEEE